MHRTRRTFTAIAAALVAFGSLALGPGSASAAAPVILSLSASVDLVDGSVVCMNGSGYNPGELVAVAQCTVAMCGAFQFVTADATGSFTTSKTVATNVTAVPSGSFSCLSVPCSIVVFRVTAGPPPWPSTFGAIAFRNSSGDIASRTASATPTTGVLDGQSLVVTGSDWYTAGTGIFQCANTPSLVCGGGLTTMSDLSGAFSASITVTKVFSGTVYTSSGPAGTATVDCTTVAGGCFIGITQGQAFAPDWTSAGIPFSFAKPVPTSKDQCKNGGWVDLVDAAQQPFRNQGDCVSFVASAGRNGAAG